METQLKETPNSDLKVSNLKELLLLLYKLLKAKNGSIPPSEYQYNYDYLNSLAMTGANKLPLLNIAVPVEELPSAKWVFLLGQAITRVVVNDTLSDFSKFSNNTPSFSIDGDIGQEMPLVDDKVQALEETEHEIEAADSQKDLEDSAWKLASIAKEISDRLTSESSGISFDVGGTPETSEVDEDLREIDQQFETLQLEESSDELAFGLSADSEEQTTESLEQSFKEIIKSNTKLLELENNFEADLDFSTPTSAKSPDFNDFNKLFSKIALPPISSRFQEDLIFAYMRVAGPNPVMLQTVSAGENPLQISDETYQQIMQKIGGRSDSLTAAMEEGRLFKADYSMLQGMENGTYPNVKKYVHAPVALFAVPPVGSPSRSLVPVAIVCQQPSVPDNPVFTVLDNAENWAIAKTIVQMADSNYHEIVSHLGRTHLFIEPFVIATKRQLPRDHHLRVLLEPHFEGTILINYGAHQLLVADKGRVDALLSGTIGSDRALAVQGAQYCLHNFNDVMLPKALESRGVARSEKLPDYPYRDDGLLIWDAIHKWVRSYLSAHYTSDRQIVEDIALQNWVRELVSEQGGRLQKLGDDNSGAIKTLDYLIDAVTTIIFTGSAQHAAVNFPQAELMSYSPAFPFAAYSQAHTNPAQPGDLMSLLPPLSQAKDQIKVCYLLGSVYYTQLGQYSNHHFRHAPQVSSALRTFQSELKGIESEINRKNQISSSRLMPYRFLKPSEIPQSINI